MTDRMGGSGLFIFQGSFLCMIMASCYATKSSFLLQKGSFYVGYVFVSFLPFAFFSPTDHGLCGDVRGW